MALPCECNSSNMSVHCGEQTLVAHFCDQARSPATDELRDFLGKTHKLPLMTHHGTPLALWARHTAPAGRLADDVFEGALDADG
jgi:hypothetical protein